MNMSRHFSPVAAAAFAFLGALAPSLEAQGLPNLYDIGVRVAPQYHSYHVQAPSNLKINEFSVPVFVFVPITSALSVDLGSAFARSAVKQTNLGKTATSTISGMTDTQIR